MAILTSHKLAFIFGILGNIVAVGVFLSPAPTFFKIYERKSSEGYDSLPYAVALFSAMMLLYYGALKTGAILLITINSFGCFVEIIYLTIYLIYASGQTKKYTIKLILLFNLCGCGLVMLLTALLSEGSKRITIVGWINATINLCVFASPLNVMRQVIRTRSVEYMPILLTVTLTFNATMWFFYGFFLKDYFIAGPNIIGFLLGLIQIALYIIYKYFVTNNEQDSTQDQPRNNLTQEEAEGNNKDNKTIEMSVV